MKPKTLLLATLVALSPVALPAEPAPLTFNGVLTMNEGQQFGLTTSDGSKSDWVKLGGSFDGFILKNYDTKSETLSLERAGQTYTLSLSNGKFSGTATASTGTKATLADAQALVDQMHFDKLIERMIEGQRKAMTRMMEQTTERAPSKISPEDRAALQKRMMDLIVEAMDPEQMKNDTAQIYADVFTKEQIAAMAAFNATPAGQAMIDKQPEIQQRLQDLMMPRMMSIRPKLRELTKEFIEQQKAKLQANSDSQTAPSSPATASTGAAQTPVAKP
jgi:hypothetical protein